MGVGLEYQAVVEYAPYQKIPAPPKADAKQGTIEDGAPPSIFALFYNDLTRHAIQMKTSNPSSNP